MVTYTMLLYCEMVILLLRFRLMWIVYRLYYEHFI